MPRHTRYLDWYLVQSHPSKEDTAKAQITNQGFRVYMPMCIKEYPKAPPREVPLFAGYMFVQFDVARARWQPIASTFGVKRLFSSDPTHPRMLPMGVVENLMRQQLMEQVSAGKQSLVIPKDCVVMVKRGNFEDRTGVCTWSDQTKVRLLMGIMNREIEIEFDRVDVTPMEQEKV